MDEKRPDGRAKPKADEPTAREKELLKFNQETIGKYKITWGSYKANYLKKHPDDKRLLKAVPESTFGMVIYPSKSGVAWDTFRDIAAACSDYFSFERGTTYLEVAAGNLSLIPPNFAKQPIREQDRVHAVKPASAVVSNIRNEFLTRSVAVAAAILLLATLWLSLQLTKLSSSLQAQEQKQGELQGLLEAKTRELAEMKRQKDTMETSIENLTRSNSVLTTDNARLTSIGNPMALIETLDLDEQPKAMPFLSAYLANYEPSIFYKSADGIYDVCRIVADRVSLGGETDFVSEFKGALSSFDMFANVAGVVKEHLPIIEQGLENGVNYRLILSDYRPENNRLGPFLVDVGEGGAEPAREVLRIHHAQIETLKQRVQSNPKFTGRFDVKWNRKTLLYTMWIRDGATPDAIAHLGVQFYGGKPTWPSLRVSRKTANDVVDSWVKEFNVIWDSAEPYDAIPVPVEEGPETTPSSG